MPNSYNRTNEENHIRRASFPKRPHRRGFRQNRKPFPVLGDDIWVPVHSTSFPMKRYSYLSVQNVDVRSGGRTIANAHCCYRKQAWWLVPLLYGRYRFLRKRCFEIREDFVLPERSAQLPHRRSISVSWGGVLSAWPPERFLVRQKPLLFSRVLLPQTPREPYFRDT